MPPPAAGGKLCVRAGAFTSACAHISE
jgi:hypothetical protein